MCLDSKITPDEILALHSHEWNQYFLMRDSKINQYYAINFTPNFQRNATCLYNISSMLEFEKDVTNVQLFKE